MSKAKLIVITGFAGSGKTTLGRCLARYLGYSYIECVEPVEYKTTLGVCRDILCINNSVVLVIPFISQLSNYENWKTLCQECNIDLSSIEVKFICLKHDIDIEHKRIKVRNANRDKYKLEHWKEYADSAKDIEIGKRYKAYIFNNTQEGFNKHEIRDLLSWLGYAYDSNKAIDKEYKCDIDNYKDNFDKSFNISDL